MCKTAYLILFCMVFLALIQGQAETVVPAGDVTGTWTATGSPYLIEGDISIPAGQTLIIEAGVDVLFQSWYKFEVNGILEANGTADSPIVFTTADTSGGWIGLRFVDAPDSSHVNYCILEFGQATGSDPLNKGGAIYMLNSNPVITNSTLRKSEASGVGGGIYMENSNPRIEHSTITENTVRSGATGYGGGIHCVDSNPVIRYSHISKNSVGVSGGFSPGRGAGGGMYLDNSDAVLEYNIISNNEIGGSGNTGSYARGAAIYASSSNPVLVGNTITENTGRLDVISDEQGGIMYLTASSADFVNTILWNNNPQDIFMAQNETTNSVMLAYCDMQGGQDSVFYGDNSTLYYQEGNTDTDPLFTDVSRENYHLSSGSPAIDAGTAYYEWDSQVLVDLESGEYVGAAPDMGALEYNSGDDINQPPSAIIESDKVEGSAPLTVSFDASKSYDDDGSISSYHWDFDDGNTSTEIAPEHTFANSNTYYVVLTVTDNDNAYDREVIKIYAHGGTSIPEGHISGTWTKSGSPYYIEGDVTVPTGSSLTIEAGVDVIFKSWYHFKVNGLLQADGTESMPITFTPEDTNNTWRGMRISDASDDSYLRWCTLEFAQATGEAPLDRGGALYVLNSSPTIENCIFRNSEADDHGGGIYLENAHAVIDGCTITNNLSGLGASNYGGGISCVDSNPVIRNSEISHNNVYVSGSFSPGRGSGGGIYLDNSDAVLEYNIISNNEIGGSGNTGSYARGAAIYAYGSDPEIINNTITGNVADLDVIADEQGGIIYISVSDPVFVNSILWNNTPQDIYIVNDITAASVMLAYCDMQGGQDSVIYGDNGTLYWQEGNIDSDPLFVDASKEDYNLTEGSPCIDAGTAFYEWNGEVLVNLSSSEYNGSAPDMGALESGFVSDIEAYTTIPKDNVLRQNYPNPFNPTTRISYTLKQAAKTEFRLYNALGQIVRSRDLGDQSPGEHHFQLDAGDLPSGVYYYQIQSDAFSKVKKCIIMK